MENTAKIKNLQKILIYIIWFLIVIIFFGTGLGLIKNKTKKKLLQRETPSEIRGKKSLYKDLGQLRAITSDRQIHTVVIFPILEYNTNDKFFEEELVHKKEKIRQIILQWFKNYQAYEIFSMSEVTIKKSLLKHINECLSLDKIEKIYFKEFTILD